MPTEQYKPTPIERSRQRTERQLVAETLRHLQQLYPDASPGETESVTETVHYVLTQVDPGVVSILGLLKWAIGYIESDYRSGPTAYNLPTEELRLLKLAQQLTHDVPEAGA